MPDAKDEKKIQMLKDTTDDNHDNHSAYLIHILEADDSVLTTPVEQDKTQTPVTLPKKELGRLGIEGKNLLVRYLAAGVSAMLVIGGAWIYTTKGNKTQKSVSPKEVENTDSVSTKGTTTTETVTESANPTEQETSQPTENSTTTPPATNATDTVIQAIAEHISEASAATAPQKPDSIPASKDTVAQAEKGNAKKLEAEAVSDKDKVGDIFQGTKKATE